MKTARLLLYTHCLIAVACIGFTGYALERHGALDWLFDRRLEVILSNPLAAGVYWLCVLSSFAFPVGVAYQTIGRTSRWQRPVILADFVLGVMQFLALLEMYPVRY
jgi:hypothetical protein